MTLTEFIGFTTGIIGKVILGISIYLAHKRVSDEGEIDEEVLKEMKHERRLIILGIALIIVGYLIEAPFKF